MKTTKQQIVDELSKSLSPQLANQHADVIGGIFESFITKQREWFEEKTIQFTGNNRKLINTVFTGIIDGLEIEFIND